MTGLPTQFYYKKNRLQQLKGFYYTVQSQSPSKAAKLMNLSKSAITLQINSLERDLKIKLFNKEKNNFFLTKEGKLFYKMAVPYIQGIDSLYERFIKNQKNKEKKILNIAVHHIAISCLLPKYIQTYNTNNLDVKIIINNISYQDALEKLKTEKIDIIFYPTNYIPDECIFKPYIEYDPILLMRKDHPLAKIKNNQLTLKKISNYSLVRIDPGLITLPAFEQAVKDYDIGSNITFKNGSWEMLMHFVRAGLGLAVVSTICLNKNDNLLIGKPLNKFFPKMIYGIMVKKGRYLNKTIKDFIDIIDPTFFKGMNVFND